MIIIQVLLFFMSSFCSFLYSSINFKTAINCQEVIAQGIIYTCYSSSIPPLKIHVITLVKDGYTVDLIPAREQREEVSSIAKRSDALIAINGANYRCGGKYNGNRVNLCYKKNAIFADPCYERGTLAWFAQEKKWLINMMYGNPTLHIGSIKIPIESINQPRASGQNIIHTKEDHRCLYFNPGYEILIHNNKVQAIYHHEHINIPENGFIVQMECCNDIEIGMKANFSYDILTDMNLPIQPDFALAGAGILISNGNMVVDQLHKEFSKSTPLIHCNDEAAADFYLADQQGYLINLPHPRTAIGFDESGTLYIVVVDGRQLASIGLTLHDLAHFMKFLGCTQAINLGGGGCSTLYCNETIINNPSQGCERPVSEALIFYQ